MFHPNLTRFSGGIYLGSLHTRDWEPVTSTSQALSLVGKTEPVRVRFTLRLKDQRSMWMRDGCKVYMDSYIALNGSCFMVTWTIFQKPPPGGKPNTKPRDQGTPNAPDCWFIPFYHVWGSAWMEIHCQLICYSGPCHTKAMTRDHEIVRAQKKVSKGHPKTLPKSRSVITDPRV